MCNLPDLFGVEGVGVGVPMVCLWISGVPIVFVDLGGPHRVCGSGGSPWCVCGSDLSLECILTFGGLWLSSGNLVWLTGR